MELIIKMKYTNKQIRTIYESLPLDIREVIASMEYTEKIQTISKKYKLMIDKTGTLSEETGFVLMGITKPQDFVNNIQNRLEVSRDVAMGIAEEINAQIFYELRESLKQILIKKTENFEDEKEENLNREDILREIEDKEHHTPPTVNAVSTPELRLEVLPPSELVVKQPDEIMIPTENTHMETKRLSEVSFQKPVTEKTQTEKPAEIITPAEQTQKQDLTSQTEVRLETKRPSLNNIIKDKMGGMVNIPKETVVINDEVSPTKTNSTKVDPYREQISF